LNRKAVNFIENFSYTLASNFISLLVSTLVVLIVPKIIGVEEYGYWQLYLFYSSYVGFLHFGWNDGIYLRYGGKEYKELDKGLFFSQFYMLVIFQIIIATIIFSSSTIFVIDTKRMFIFKMTAICMLIVNVRCLLLYILQVTNRIKEYAQITMMDRILYCCLIIVLIVVCVREYKLMIVVDLIGKFASLSYAMFCCSDIVFRRVSTFYFNFKESMENIGVGIKLTIANIASLLIIGVVRFGIERLWDVPTFGKVSLTLSISNLMMLFINAVGIIMFPILRRTDDKKLPGIYITMRDFLMVILFGVLIVYYPFKVILSFWLPKYADSLMYMALVFPMCVFEGKMALLINTYLKTLRKEKLMLKINLISLVLSVIITFVNTALLRNLNLAIVSIVVLLAFRCVLAEMFLSKIFKISLYKDMILELTVTLIFILTGWFVNSWLGVLLYAVTYITYLLIKKKDITNTIKNVKLLMKA
jgi:O-antigen/teichoic acid export membrane protein